MASSRFLGATTAYSPFVATFRPVSSAPQLSLAWSCNANQGLPSGELHIDDIKVGLPDLSCAMYLQVPPIGSNVDSQYLTLLDPSQATNNGFTADLDSATQYTLDPYGNMIVINPGYPTSYWENDSQATTYENIFVENLTYFQLTGSGQHLVSCSIDGATLALSCSNYGSTAFSSSPHASYSYEDGPVLAIGAPGSTPNQGVQPISLQVVYVSYGG